MGNMKPRHVILPLKPFLEKLIDGKIEKDLDDGEELCPTCGGFSIALRDNPYFKREGQYQMSQFKNEQLVLMSCPNCYNGVVKRCQFCGALLSKKRLRCDCAQQKALEDEELRRKKQEQFDKAEIAPPEVEKACEFFYSDVYPYYDGYFEDWDEFFDAWNELEEEDRQTRPEYVWVTQPDKMHIDADSIIENATEELYEDAVSDISDEEVKRLQSFLDDWCKHCGVRTSYSESHRYKVRIPWSEYDKMHEKEVSPNAYQAADH